jgi:uncharacterized membrane protein
MTELADERGADSPAGRGKSRGRAAVTATVAVAVGLVLIVVGTFLPWLRSGSSSRNSFRAAGLIDRLLHPPGVAGIFLTVWPGVVFACAAAIAGLVIGLRWLATLLAALLGVVVAAVAGTTLLLPARTYASVIVAGPAVCVAGAALVLGGVGALAALSLRHKRRRG